MKAIRLTGNKYAFSRDFKKKGMIKLSTYLRQYKYAEMPSLPELDANTIPGSAILLISRQMELCRRGMSLRAFENVPMKLKTNF